MIVNLELLHQRIRQLKSIREGFENRLIFSQPMIEGSLIERKIFCGKKSCRKCREKIGHGPYFYLSKKEKGKTRLIYLGKAGRDEVELAQNFKDFQKRVVRLKRINQEIIGLIREIGQHKIKQNLKIGNMRKNKIIR